MKRLLISAIALAGLGGCATYDYAGGSAPGGYYSGSPSYEYSYPDGYYGGYGGSYGYGLYGGYGGFGGYGGYGYSYSPGYYGYYNRPYYVIRPRPRPPHGDHDGHHDNDHRPPVSGGGGGNRPPPGGPRPWRPGQGRPRPPVVGGEEGRPRPQLPDRLRPPSERTGPPRVQGEGRPMRPATTQSAPTRPVQQSQPRPASAPAVPRESHFRNRPIGRER
ncbi:MAG: hypothetical protein ABWX87_10975 [Pseudoxanthomonas sp.]